MESTWLFVSPEVWSCTALSGAGKWTNPLILAASEALEAVAVQQTAVRKVHLQKALVLNALAQESMVARCKRLKGQWTTQCNILMYTCACIQVNSLFNVVVSNKIHKWQDFLSCAISATQRTSEQRWTGNESWIGRRLLSFNCFVPFQIDIQRLVTWEVLQQLFCHCDFHPVSDGPLTPSGSSYALARLLICWSLTCKTKTDIKIEVIFDIPKLIKRSQPNALRLLGFEVKVPTDKPDPSLPAREFLSYPSFQSPFWPMPQETLIWR